ncbi:hypothetical protein ABN028_19730 [Actinopolymorpha sp. B17G11]|uniref:hypothetical protein n=1 Tax=Actinopolymorpha sp. B17G11 TaxID=3160861 RepID=UPI0032E3CE29
MTVEETRLAAIETIARALEHEKTLERPECPGCGEGCAGHSEEEECSECMGPWPCSKAVKVLDVLEAFGLTVTTAALYESLLAENALLRRPMAKYTQAGDLEPGWIPADAGRLHELEAVETEADHLRKQVRAVRAFAAEHEMGALRWAEPLPVPAWIPQLRQVVDGDHQAEACTGISAEWCPNHGTCRCPEDEHGNRPALDHPDCPLHAPESAHGEAPPVEPADELERLRHDSAMWEGACQNARATIARVRELSDQWSKEANDGDLGWRLTLQELNGRLAEALDDTIGQEDTPV